MNPNLQNYIQNEINSIEEKIANLEAAIAKNIKHKQGTESTSQIQFVENRQLILSMKLEIYSDNLSYLNSVLNYGEQKDVENNYEIEFTKEGTGKKYSYELECISLKNIHRVINKLILRRCNTTYRYKKKGGHKKWTHSQ